MVRTMNPSASHTTRYAIEEIRALMGRRRVSQKELGTVLAMSQPTISARMRGEVTFNLDELEQIAAHFDVPITDLLPPPERRDERRSPMDGPRNRCSSTVLASV
jgi:transcriptional regulator with XRE-family HTH domain